MNEQLPYYRKVLADELLNRVERNPRYSLRSFARALEIEPGALSKILSGKRFLTEKLAARIFEAINLDVTEQEKFLFSIAAVKKASGVGRMSPGLKQALLDSETASPTRELSGEVFRFISDWYHYAILEMTCFSRFKPDPKWIAAKLQISQTEASQAWQRLLELELVTKQSGRWKKTESWIDTKDKQKTSSAHKRRQKQILEKSLHSLENDPLELRNHSSFTLPIDIKKIPEAKQKIQKFMQELGLFLTNEKKEHVYELTVNLFPLEKIDFKGELK